MPFTPFHMGPGLLVKGILQGSFSLMIFGWSQIVIDIQPLVVMLSGRGHVHGFTHTYLGATLIAAVSAVSGKFAADLVLRILRRTRFTPISWPVAIGSALIGTYSHVVLDAIMHSDVEPFAPLTLVNPFLGIISVATLHKLCLLSGLAGAGLYFLALDRS